MSLRRLFRSPAAFWLAAVALATVTGLTVSGLLGRLRAEAVRYGDTRPALVAVHALDAGRRVTAADTEIRRLPAAFLPEGALAELPAGDSRTVVVPVFPGEVVVAAKLAPDGLSPVAALLPEGTRALAIPAGAGTTTPLRTGDRVDVLASFDADTAGDGDPTFAVAEDALVVDVAEEAVTVAVDAADAARVAFALTNGVVTLALTPGPT